MKRLLGTMLASGMAGHNRRAMSMGRVPTAGVNPLFGMSHGRRGHGGGLMKGAGLAALGMLAYRAYQDYQKNNPPTAARPTGTQRPTGPATGGDGGLSLGERLANVLKGPEPAPEAAVEDQKALLLIRAMIAAANADGKIDEDERQRILGKLDEAGADQDDHRLMERELQSPMPLDRLLPDVKDEETAEQFYLASKLAIDEDNQTERSYLQYLASRLNLETARMQAIDQAVGQVQGS